MKLNFRFNLFVLVLMAVSLFSCTEDEKDKVVISDKAVITKFQLHSKTDKAIEKYFFTIDNDKKVIYNADSMLYKTRIDSLCPIISPKFHAVYLNDTIDLYKLDSAYLNFNNPIKFTVVAADKKTSADYIVNVNVHKVDPDTFVWEGLKSQVFEGVSSSERAVYVNNKLGYFAAVDGKLSIYTSDNGRNWSLVSPKGLNIDVNKTDLRNIAYSEDVVYVAQGMDIYSSSDFINWSVTNTTGVVLNHVLCFMDGRLYGVTDDMHFAVLEGSVWNDLGRLPFDFPVKGGAVCVADAPSGKSRVFVVGGIDSEGNYLSSVWSTENGSYWSNMVPGEAQFTPRAYAAVIQYANGLILWGGQKSDGTVVEDHQIYSKDFGMNWGATLDKSVIGDMYRPRYDLSVMTTPNGYIYLIGGRVSSANPICDVWHGYQYASLEGFKR